MSEPGPVGVALETLDPGLQAPSPRRIALALALTAAAMIGAGVSALFLNSTTPAPAAAVYKYRIETSSADFPGEGTRVPVPIAISPDGRWLAYRVENPSSRSGSLYLHGLDEWEARPNPGTEGGLSPFFSSDGKYLAFLQQREARLYRVPVPPEGSGPQPIPGKTESWGTNSRAVWLDDGSIVYSSGSGRGGASLWRLPAGGGDAVRLIAPDDGGTESFYPERVPGTSTVLYTVIDANAKVPRIEALFLESGERKFVTEGSFPKLSPSSGHLLFLETSLVHVARGTLRRGAARADR